MTKFLTELITDKTPILTLKQNGDIEDKEKLSVLGLNCSLSNSYVQNMYNHNGIWYFYKKDNTNEGYSFYILDELMGTYLAKSRNLPTVSYEVAQVDKDYGLASANFKKEGFRYYYPSQLIDAGLLFKDNTKTIDILKSLTVSLENEKEFLNQLFNFFALDIHMLQKDRGFTNLQLQIDERTNHLALAALYDYSNCSPKIGMEGLNLGNIIMVLNDLSVRSLLRKYPEFTQALELCLQQSMKEIWDQICIDYHFNQDCSSYEKVKEYYEVKDKTQKQYIKQMVTDTKR